MIRELVMKNRSYRRFDYTVKIPGQKLRDWVGLARFLASGRNMQPLKYLISNNETTNGKIFPNLGWAGYLTDWPGPAEEERPVAYIVVLHDKSLSDKYYCDDGLAIQNILLGAVEDGFGGCIIGSANKTKIARILELPGHLEILWIIALGKPSETVVVEEMGGDIKYWRDEDGVHHVPKRPLDEIIFKELAPSKKDG